MAVDWTAPIRVLLLEDSDDDAELVMRELRRAGYVLEFERVTEREKFLHALHAREWDVVISDHAMPGYDGMEALRDVLAIGKDVPFILVSGSIGEARAVAAMKAGAQDYVLKADLTRLPAAVVREVREARARAEQRRMRERLVISERMATAGTLAAGVAHEINNPLAVAFGNVEYSVERLAHLGAALLRLPDDVRGMLAQELDELFMPLEETREALRRIRDIVRDVKLFSRPDAAQHGPVDVRRVFESSIRMAWNELRHRAAVVRDYREVPLVDTNDARLGQVLLNLLVNAAQALPEGRASKNEIRVSTRLEDDRVVMAVRDQGTGIPREHLARIFDPFFTTKPVGVGTGLGLAICHRIITDLGGDIVVESEVGEGTLVEVSLPATDAVRARRAKSRAKTPPLPQLRVLIVDDEPSNARGLARQLSDQHQVEAVTSAREALARIVGGERYDVLLCDLMMPDFTGMELHHELERTIPDQAKRMVFVTGGAFTSQAREFFDTTDQPRVEKPYDRDAIEAAIRDLLVRVQTTN